MSQRAQTFEELEPELRRMWEAKRPDVVLDWMEIREAYRFGWTRARLPEYAGRSFSEVEKDLAEHWYLPEIASEESAWDYVKPAVREGWEQSRRFSR